MSKITKEETLKIKELYLTGTGSTTIAKMFGRTNTGIISLLRREGIEIRPKIQKIYKKDIGDICKLYKDGMSAPKISAIYNVTEALILRYLTKNNIERRNSSECHRIYSINEDYFDEINTERKAYFLGFYYADGSNLKSENASCISLNEKDDDILIKLSKEIYVEEPEKRLKYYTRIRDIGNGVKEYKTCTLSIHSKHICTMLEKHGCMQNKTFKITFPEWLDPKLYPHFIRGYYDGDGGVYVTYKKRSGALFRICGTLNLLNTIKSILKEETNANSKIYQVGNIYRINSAGNVQVERILDWLYKDATIWLDRKYNEYVRLQNRPYRLNKKH